jgi:hypothetical protein
VATQYANRRIFCYGTLGLWLLGPWAWARRDRPSGIYGTVHGLFGRRAATAGTA